MTPARSSTARKRLADSRDDPASWARSACVAVTSTSVAAVPGGNLLRDKVAEDDRDPALDRLEGLPREAVVGLTQPPPERDHQPHRDLVMFGHQAPHVWPEHSDDARRLDRFDRRRAKLVLEHRELAEDVSGPERRERDRAPVRVGADRAGLAEPDDVTGVARVALAENNLAGLEGARDRDLGDALKVVHLERGEDGHTPEQLDNLR